MNTREKIVGYKYESTHQTLPPCFVQERNKNLKMLAFGKIIEHIMYSITCATLDDHATIW